MHLIDLAPTPSCCKRHATMPGSLSIAIRSGSSEGAALRVVSSTSSARTTRVRTLRRVEASFFALFCPSPASREEKDRHDSFLNFGMTRPRTAADCRANLAGQQDVGDTRLPREPPVFRGTPAAPISE